MAFDWRRYVELANELIAHPGSPQLAEASLRTSISRSYYGVFGIAAGHLEKRVPIQRIDTHKFVRDQYRYSSIKAEEKIGNDLLSLWQERKAADYDRDAHVDAGRAALAHEMAKRVLQRLSSIGAI
jgi:hypothetical protein